MTAKIRLAIAALVAGLALVPAAALAQEAPPEATDTTGQVGPRELQDFNLPGTVTRPAEPQPSESNVSAPARRPATNTPSATPPRQAPEIIRRPAESDALPDNRPPPGEAPASTTRPSSSVTVQLPPVGDLPTDSSAATDPVEPAAESSPSFPASDVPLPWLIAAAMLIAGAGVYLWRNRRREAVAGGPDLDSYQAPAAPRAPAPPGPAPAALPATVRSAPEPDPIGIVSTRLRPWLEIAFRPTSCRIDDDNVTIEFELGLFNSGSTPARAVLVEASYFNAGEDQDREIGQFFANPVGAGERAVSLAPLKRMVISTKVVTPRAQVREFDAGGRKVFVPLIGFNALYRWATGGGQTSASFILGRNTKGEKLAPFRLDMVGREFRSLGNRPLPVAVRD